MTIAYSPARTSGGSAARWRMGAAALPHLSLGIIMSLQAVVSLLVLRNTAFQDEALYLFAGRQIVTAWQGGPPVIEPYATYFSGYPSLYPALAGAIDMTGGLEAVRFFSLLCMLGVTACVYAITLKLFNRTSAICAAAIFACQGSVLFIGRLATYDALCLLCLALALTLALRLNRERAAQTMLGAGGIGVLLVLATGVKYAGLLFVPSILLIFAIQTFHAEREGWRRALFIGAALASTAGGFGLAWLLIGKDALAGVGFTTTNRVAFIRTSAAELALEVVTLGGIALALGLVGFILARRQRFWLMASLVGTALLAPAYHIYKGEQVSLNKHIAFAVFFIAPLAGLAMSKIISAPHPGVFNPRWPIGLALCLCIFSFGLQQAQNQYHVWADSTQMIATLRTQVRPGTGHYLAEEYDVARYYLRDVTDPWQWSSLNWFEYTDKAHHTLYGVAAYRAAIAEGYFDVIELNYGYNVALDYAIDGGLKDGKQYILIAKIPYVNAYGPGYYWIWVKRAPATPATGK